MKKLRKPKSAITLLNEALGIENAPSLSNSSTFEEIKEAAADALGLNPEDMTIGLVPAKESLEDFIDLKKTGDLWISFKTSVEDTDSIARQLNGFNFLDQIVINGETGRDLSAIVSDGSVLAGNIVITSKSTEAQIRLFLPHLGGEVSEQAFEQYWSGIGGKCIGQQTVERLQQQMAQLAGGRGMRGMLGGRRGRQQRYLREENLDELGETPEMQYRMGRVAGRRARRGDTEGRHEAQEHALRRLPRQWNPGDETDDLYRANHLGYQDEVNPELAKILDAEDSFSGMRRRKLSRKIGRSVPENLNEVGDTEKGMEQVGRLTNRQLWQGREKDSFKTQDQAFNNNLDFRKKGGDATPHDRKLINAYWRGQGDESTYPKEFFDVLANLGGAEYWDNDGGASVDFTEFAKTHKFKDIVLYAGANGYEENFEPGEIVDFVDNIGYAYRDLLKKGSSNLEEELERYIKKILEDMYHDWYERAYEEYWDYVDGQRADYYDRLEDERRCGLDEESSGEAYW